MVNIALLFGGQVRHIEVFEWFFYHFKKHNEFDNYNFNFFISTDKDFNLNLYEDILIQFDGSDFIKFHETSTINRYLHLMNAYNLMLKYEVNNKLKYDYIVLSRPDVICDKEEIISFDKLFVDSDVIRMIGTDSSVDGPCKCCGLMTVLEDFVFVSNSNTMDLIATKEIDQNINASIAKHAGHSLFGEIIYNNKIEFLSFINPLHDKFIYELIRTPKHAKILKDNINLTGKKLKQIFHNNRTTGNLGDIGEYDGNRGVK